ncbi:MAG TPA: hypothetical protein VK689_05065, partial [Armatimonadota bacterium]|nr:hypothetical protein [Armatimonadota bacterium]
MMNGGRAGGELSSPALFARRAPDGRGATGARPAFGVLWAGAHDYLGESWIYRMRYGERDVVAAGDLEIELCGERMVLLPERAAYRPEHRTLLVADPHFGK